MDPLNVGTLVLVIITLVVAVLALRDVRKIASLAEERIEYLHEEQERMKFHRETHKRLEGELERERQERLRMQEELEHERRRRLEALQKAEHAEQEATKKATQQLRERMDQYLKELDEDGRRDIRRVK